MAETVTKTLPMEFSVLHRWCCDDCAKAVGLLREMVKKDGDVHRGTCKEARCVRYRAERFMTKYDGA